VTSSKCNTDGAVDLVRSGVARESGEQPASIDGGASAERTRNQAFMFARVPSFEKGG